MGDPRARGRATCAEKATSPLLSPCHVLSLCILPAPLSRRPPCKPPTYRNYCPSCRQKNAPPRPPPSSLSPYALKHIPAGFRDPSPPCGAPGNEPGSAMQLQLHAHPPPTIQGGLQGAPGEGSGFRSRFQRKFNMYLGFSLAFLAFSFAVVSSLS